LNAQPIPAPVIAPVIAIVDDEEAVRAGLSTLMRSIDLRPEVFASADAFVLADPARYVCVLSDIQMPGRSGIDLLAHVRGVRPDLPVILMTAFPDERVREQARSGGAYRFLAKPCDPDMIVELVEGLLSPDRV
jgi:two-component system, LuxR family, response regulator FixJ